MTPEIKMPTPVNFTNNAVNKVKELIAEEGSPDLKLRVFVSGGGCSGFKYNFSLDKKIEKDDVVFNKTIIDNSSLEIINGSVVDYQKEMIGSSFVIKKCGNKCRC